MDIHRVNTPPTTLGPNEEVGVKLNDKAYGLISVRLRFTWPSAEVSDHSEPELFGWAVGQSAVTEGRRGLIGRLTRWLTKADKPSRPMVVCRSNRLSVQEPHFMMHTGLGSEVIRLSGLAQQGYVLFGVRLPARDGVPSPQTFDVELVVTDTEGNRTTVPLDHNLYSPWTLIARLDLTGQAGYVVRRTEVHGEPGNKKSPVLYADGKFGLHQGPEDPIN